MPQIQYQKYSISTLKGYLYLPSFDYISLPPFNKLFCELTNHWTVSSNFSIRTSKDNKR